MPRPFPAPPAGRWPLLVALLAGLSGALAAAPAAVPDPSDPGLAGAQRVEALAARVAAAQGALRSLEASFRQRRSSELLVAPEEATGRFSYASPDRVRWEYDSPRPLTVVIRGSEMTTWYRDLGRAERIDVGRYSTQVLRYLGAAGSLETLRQYFDVAFSFPADAATPYAVKLAPRFERVRRRVEGMTLWIDRATYLPSRFVVEEPGGDRTEFEFQQVRVNPTLPADLFDLRLPPEVEVRTLAAGERPTG